MLVFWGVMVALVATLLFVLAKKERARFEWVVKPAAALVFIAAGAYAGAFETTWGTVLFGGLVLAAGRSRMTLQTSCCSAQPAPMIQHGSLALVLTLAAGCYASHGVETDARPMADDAGVDASDAALECDFRAIECTALPDCAGPRPAETLYCDDVRICLFSDPGDEMAMAIAEVSERIQCTRADSCDFLCGLVDGVFDDQVRSELCDIMRVAPMATIECALYGP